MRSCCLLTFLILAVTLSRGAVIPPDDNVKEQGLYSKSDQVIILTHENFERKVYGQRHALVVQFYNSYCGHCRAFSPKYKSLAADIKSWKRIVSLAVIDCSVEENNEICRQFEVMAYPSIRYLHENYVKANSNIGDRLNTPNTAGKLKSQIVNKIQEEQTNGRMKICPPLSITAYDTYSSALNGVPSDTIYIFLVFEAEKSLVGSEIIMDLSGYNNISVKRAYNHSKLAKQAGFSEFPAVIAVSPTFNATPLRTTEPTKEKLLEVINTFLGSKSYQFPVVETDQSDVVSVDSTQDSDNIDTDAVYYSDLEATLKTSLHTEVTRHKTLSGEPLQALMDFLSALISSFPFRLNLKEYVTDIRNHLSRKSTWSGNELYELVKRLENEHAPVFTPDLDYIRCKGSEPKYRGYSCGLWTLFHTLTVNAANLPGTEGPKVLRAMHGYIKHFFGCTECSQHFQEMAARNRLFEVKDNDKAILWLWISHNEVNLRLAGDVTEDPKHPKMQFPSVARCPECRLSRGAWNLPAVYEYLHNIYGLEHLRDKRSMRSPTAAAMNNFSNLDMGMLSLLYILSFIIIIIVLKYYFTKYHYRRRFHKHALGKV